VSPADHYNAEGWTYLASFAAPAYARKLAGLAALGGGGGGVARLVAAGGGAARED